MVPAPADPWFLTFNADVEFHVVMSAEYLQLAGLDKPEERRGQLFLYFLRGMPHGYICFYTYFSATDSF